MTEESEIGNLKFEIEGVEALTPVPVYTPVIDADVKQAIDLIVATEAFEKSFRERSFSGRHPELGKMIKCEACGQRHRSSILHQRVFAKNDDGSPRVAMPKHRPKQRRARAMHSRRQA